MDKIIGFAPDADPTLPGVLTAVSNMIPYENGMRGCPSGVTPAGVPVLPSDCRGAAIVTKLNDTRRIFAGTSTKLYELVGGAWSDVGITYSGGVDTRWSISQFGDATIASNLADTIQRSSGAGFTSIASAPKAKIVFSVGAQLMALNTNDGADKPDGWHCCATFNENDWVASTTTLAAKGRIVAQPGAFTAGGRLGEYAVAYKEQSIFIGQFAGAPSVWDWAQVPGGNAGCVGQDAWCDIGGAHFFVGQDNLWIFDGSRPSPVADGLIRQWFFDNSNVKYRYRTQCSFDRQNNVVWIFYPSISSEKLDKAIVYHIKSKMWGAADMPIQASLNYISNGVAIDDLASISSTIDGLGLYSFNSQFWLSGGRTLAIFNTSNQLQSLTGVSVNSSMKTSDVGSEQMYTLLSEVRLRFAPGFKPASANIQTYIKDELGDIASLSSTASMDQSRFHVLDSSRWHSATVNFTGDYKLMEIGATLSAEGEE